MLHFSAVILSFMVSPRFATVSSRGGQVVAKDRLSVPEATNPETAKASDSTWLRTPDGLKYREVSRGTGAFPLPDSVVSLHYTISFADSGDKLGTSRGHSPLTFALGKQHVEIFEDAVKCMRVGSSIRLIIPSSKIPNMQSQKVPKDHEGEPLLAELELLSIETGWKALIPSLLPPGSRRKVIFRTLFALSFLPYFLPEDLKPDVYKFGDPAAMEQVKNSIWLGGGAGSLDSLFQ